MPGMMGVGRIGRFAPIQGGASYEAEAVALFTRFSTPPDGARKSLINAVIKSLKTAGVWSKLDALYVMAAADSQAARLNWVADAYNLTAVSSPAFTADRGYQGDGSTSYLSTGFEPTVAPSPKFALNSAHLSAWSRTDANNSAYFDIGASGKRINARSALANTFRGELNDGTTSNFGSVTTSLGLFGINRSGASARQAYQNGVSVGSDTPASTSIVADPITLLKVVTNFSARQLAVGSYGASLSAAEWLAFYNALNTYLTAVGAA